MKKILVIASVMLFGVMGANAAGTLAGTSVTNNASLTYEVGGVTQTAVNTTTPDVFVVDRKVDFVLVDDDGDQVSTTPGQNDVNTTWTLTNEGNMDQNFTLVSNELATGTSVYGDADTHDTTAKDIWYSTDGGVNWVAYTTQIELDPDQSIMVRVASDIAVAQNNGDVMNIDLVATAVTAAGATETNTAGVDNPAVVDTVLADGSTDPSVGGNGDGAADAIYMAQGGYIIVTAVVDVTKTSCVTEDPINGASANAKRIPGATITYMLDINNTGTVNADSVSISDALDVVRLDYGSITNIRVNDNQANCACTNGTHVAGGVVGANTGATPNVVIDAGTIISNTHTCVSFEVDIQ